MNSSKVILIALLLLGFLVVFGCSSNQPSIDTEEGFMDGTDSENQSEIDELFQIINESEGQQEEQAGEDEVFELLGIQKEQKESGTVEEQAGGSDDQLKGEIELLEQRLADKDAEIAELKSEVTNKDEEISLLESGVAANQPASGGSTQLSGNYKQDYQLALDEYNARNYKTAIQMFEDLLAIDQRNSLADNCRYWIGECYYGLGNYNQAIIEFTKVFSFTKANKMADAQLKLGLCYWRLGDSQRAAQEFERLINEFPDSEYVEKAQEFITRLQ